MRILIVDNVHPFLTDFLTRSGYKYDIITDIDYDGYLALEDDYDGLIIRSKFVVDWVAIDTKRDLKFIIRLGSGVENIAVEYAQKQGISCFNTPAGNAPSVGEYCLAALLSAVKHLPTADAEVKNGVWLRKKNYGKDLCDLKVGIIGYGHTGKAFARVLNGLVEKVYTHDKYKTAIGDEFAEEVDLETLMTVCDVISLHVNYIEENHHFFNQKIIDKAGKPFVFINSSRGLAVKTADLLTALQTGRISFACLDVLEYETSQLQLPPKAEWPNELQELATLNNVILTPHIAGQTSDSEFRHAELAAGIIGKIGI
ncbi:MAG: hypothetical protein LBV02_05705 [Bacteroidales bacterium]|jgi:D-3-phosphoglycerate dehydrogenase|nr:hypothetical protein [Bacteroidales bacterium]